MTEKDSIPSERPTDEEIQQVLRETEQELADLGINATFSLEIDDAEKINFPPDYWVCRSCGHRDNWGSNQGCHNCGSQDEIIARSAWCRLRGVPVDVV